MRGVGLLLLLSSMILLQGQQSQTKSQWDTLKFFLGNWEGTSQGEPGQGKGERHYDLALDGKFIRAGNRTVYPPQEKNPKGEVHEDFGFYSFDKKRMKLVFRQFHKEGFVNEYVEQEISPDGKTVILVSERIENIPDGWRARETYKFLNQDEYMEIFELAEPQKDFAVYSQSHWRRVK